MDRKLVIWPYLEAANNKEGHNSSPTTACLYIYREMYPELLGVTMDDCILNLSYFVCVYDIDRASIGGYFYLGIDSSIVLMLL